MARRLLRVACLALVLLGVTALPAHAANVTVSGTALEDLTYVLGTEWTGCDNATNNIRLVLDGGAYSATTTCDTTTGAWSFANVPLSATHVITVYIDTASGTEQGVTYTRNADLTSNITGLRISEDRVRLRTESVAVGPLTTAHINLWDNTQDTSLPTISDGTVLSTTLTQRIGLMVDAGRTFQPNGQVTADKVTVAGTWTAGANTLIITGTGDDSCSDDVDVVDQDPICDKGTGTFNAGTGITRLTLLNGPAGDHSDLSGSMDFNVLQVHPGAAGKSICIANSGATITAASADLGNGTTVDTNVYGTFISAGNVTLNAAALMEGDGLIQVGGNFHSIGTGRVDDWDLGVRMRPAGGTVTFGSTSGGSNWQFDTLYTETAAGAATVRAAAGGTGGIIPDYIVVGNTGDAATTILDLNTNDRYMRADGGDIVVTARGQLEMSNSQPLDGVGDMVVDNLVNSNGGALNLQWSLHLNATGTMNMLASNATFGWDVNILGTYTVVGAGQLTIDGNFTKGGTFNAGAGTVTFGDSVNPASNAKPSLVTMTSPTTFFNLRNVTPNKVVRIDKDHVSTISGTLTLTGGSCTARAALASESDGTPFSIAAAVVSANFADIGDSNQTSGSRTATNSWNHGGNTNWTFSTPCASHTVSGFALQSEGGAGWSQCNGVTPNVSLSINGFSPTTVPCTAGTGAFTLTTSLEPDTMLVAFLDPTAPGDRGATYSRGPSPVANFGGLTIVKGQTRVRSETASAVTNVDVGRYDSDFDPDVSARVYDDDVAEFPSGIELLIEAGDTYAPGETVYVDSVDIAGTLGPTGTGTDEFDVWGTGTNPSCTAAINVSVPVCIRPGGDIAMHPNNEFHYHGDGALNVAASDYPKLLLISDGPGNTYQLGTSATDNVITVGAWLGITTDTTASTTSFNPSVNVLGDLDLDGVLSGSGTGTFSVLDDVDGNGDINLTAGLFQFLGQSGSDSEICSDDSANYSFWDFEAANTTGVTRTVTFTDDCDVLVRNDLRVGRVADTNTSRFDFDTGDPIIEVDGDVLVTTRGDLRAPSAATVTVAGDFTNNGAFSANGGTVEFDTAGTTSNVFHSTATAFGNLRVVTQPKQVRFQAGRTTTVAGTFTVTGTSCALPVELRSTTGGSQYTLGIGTVAFQYATMMDSIASPANSAALTGDLGNNSGWTFTGGCTPGPSTMFVHDTNASAGNPNEPDVGSDTFHMSFVNAGSMDYDQQQARVITTPLSNVVGLWQFDTATGQATDTSGNGRTLTLTGAPTSPAGQANFAEALGLDGATQHASVSHATLNLSTNFTVEAWVRAPDTTGTKVILERTSGTSRNYKLDFSGGNLRAHATRNAGATFTVSTTAAPFADLGWHHVALVVDAGNTLRLYLDGASVGTPQAVGGAVWSGAAAVSIGRNAVGAEYFPGQVDDVRISNVARDVGQINGFAKLRNAHNKVVWTSAALPVTCAAGNRCADIVYAGPALRRPDARYYVEARGRLQPWVAMSAWSTADWFETSALLTVSVPSGPIAFGTTLPGSNALAIADVDVTSTLTSGYKLYVSDGSDTAGMTGAGTLPDWTAAWDDPQPWPQATYGYFGATLLTGTGKDTVEWGTGTTPNDWANVKYVGVRNTTPTLLVDRAGPTGATDTFEIGVRSSPGTGQAAGAYSTTLTFTAIANP